MNKEINKVERKIGTRNFRNEEISERSAKNLSKPNFERNALGSRLKPREKVPRNLLTNDSLPDHRIGS